MTAQAAPTETTSAGEAATAETVAQQRDALVERLFQANLGLLDLFTVYLSDRLEASGLRQRSVSAAALTKRAPRCHRV